MCVCLYVCHVCMFIGLYLCMTVCLCACMPVCLYVCMSVSLYVCMYACMHVFFRWFLHSLESKGSKIPETPPRSHRISCFSYATSSLSPTKRLLATGGPWFYQVKGITRISINGGSPKFSFILENPIQIDDLGVLPLQETFIFWGMAFDFWTYPREQNCLIHI